MYIYIYMCVLQHRDSMVCIYIYIHIEREGESNIEILLGFWENLAQYGRRVQAKIPQHRSFANRSTDPLHGRPKDGRQQAPFRTPIQRNGQKLDGPNWQRPFSLLQFLVVPLGCSDARSRTTWLAVKCFTPSASSRHVSSHKKGQAGRLTYRCVPPACSAQCL